MAYEGFILMYNDSTYWLFVLDKLKNYWNYDFDINDFFMISWVLFDISQSLQVNYHHHGIIYHQIDKINNKMLKKMFHYLWQLNVVKINKIPLTLILYYNS